MTAHAFATSVLGRALPEDSLGMTEQETQRVIVLAGSDGVSSTVRAMCDALLIELVAINSHHDLPFRLHHHRPMAVISEIDPQGIASCAALRSIAAYNPEMPVLLVAGDDPTVLGTIDAAEQLWCLSSLHRLAAPPAASDLIGFLFQAGRHSGLGRLIPLS
jgi:DNA-binding NtrC family response regulator